MRLEHEEQKKLFSWAKIMEKQYPALALMFAIPNEAYMPLALPKGYKNYKSIRLKNAIIRNKYLTAEGLKKGVPDIFLPYSNFKYFGLFIELKKPKSAYTKSQLKRAVREEQIWWLENLREQGFMALVCWGFEDAKNIILKYLAQEKIERDIIEI